MSRRSPLLLLLLSVALLAPAWGAVPAHAADRPDPWITFTTKIALLTAGGLDAININVDTVQGLVTLHGRVDTPEQKAEAEELARKTEGVRDVRNLLQVMPDTQRTQEMKLDDAAAKAALEKSLHDDPLLADSPLRVASVTNGVALLAGDARSLSDELRAIELARATPGVRHVASEMRGPSEVYDTELWHDGALPPAPGGRPSPIRDAWITMATKFRLLANDRTPMGINVDTDGGVVTLFGTVPTEESKAAAESEANSVGGVRGVRNELQVVPEAAKAQADIQDDRLAAVLVAALKEHSEFADTKVEVKGGVARLTGHVRSQVDRLSAGVLVRSTVGVKSVMNDLAVEPKA